MYLLPHNQGKVKVGPTSLIENRCDTLDPVVLSSRCENDATAVRTHWLISYANAQRACIKSSTLHNDNGVVLLLSYGKGMNSKHGDVTGRWERVRIQFVVIPIVYPLRPIFKVPHFRNYRELENYSKKC